MKKTILILLVLALIAGLTSCSQDVLAKISEFTSATKNNVYNIKVDNSQVAAATEKLTGSVATDSDGNVKVEFSTAAEIINSVADVKNSDQKMDALKKELSKPVSSEENAAAVKTQLDGKKDEISDKLNNIDTTNLSDNQKKLVEDIKNAVSDIEISDNPTMAELATVAVLNEIATKTQAIIEDNDETKLIGEDNNLTEEGLKVVDQALGALDTLKVVTEVADIDLLGDLDLKTLLNNFTGRSIEDKVLKYLAPMEDTIEKILELITTDDKFDSVKYKAFIAQSKILKAAYDFVTLPYLKNAKDIEDLDAILKMNINHGLTMEDLVLYAIVTAFATADKIDKAATATDDSTPFETYIKNFVNGNFEMLDDLDDDEFDLELNKTDWENLCKAVETYIGGTSVKAILNSNCPLYADFFKLMGTCAVMIVDAEYSEIFNILPKVDGEKIQNISGIVKLIEEAK